MRIAFLIFFLVLLGIGIWRYEDAPIDDYPDCHVEWPFYIGDGECDGGEYAVEECGYDGGDCLLPGDSCDFNEECTSQVCIPNEMICE